MNKYIGYKQSDYVKEECLAWTLAKWIVWACLAAFWGIIAAVILVFLCQ